MILKNFGTYHIRVGATGVIGAANEKHIAMERQNEEGEVCSLLSITST